MRRVTSRAPDDQLSARLCPSCLPACLPQMRAVNKGIGVGTAPRSCRLLCSLVEWNYGAAACAAPPGCAFCSVAMPLSACFLRGVASALPLQVENLHCLNDGLWKTKTLD